MANLVVYSTQNDAVHESLATVFRHKPAMFAQLLVNLLRGRARIGAEISRTMTRCAVGVGDVSSGVAGGHGVGCAYACCADAPSRDLLKCRCTAFFLLLLFLGLMFSPVEFDQGFQPNDAFLEVLIRSPSLPRGCGHARGAFYTSLPRC